MCLIFAQITDSVEPDQDLLPFLPYFSPKSPTLGAYRPPERTLYYMYKSDADEVLCVSCCQRNIAAYNGVGERTCLH